MKIITSGFDGILKGRRQFLFYIFVVISPDADRDCLPKHVACMRSKWLSERHAAFICRVTVEVIVIEDILMCFSTHNKTISLLRQKHNNSI
jgi:hypothetical protein